MTQRYGFLLGDPTIWLGPWLAPARADQPPYARCLFFRSAIMPAFVFVPAHHVPNMVVSTLYKLLRCGACAVLVFIVSACTPSYDWRLVHDANGAYSVMLPAKPIADERTLTIGDTPMKMRMQTADVDDVMFAIGVVTLPSDDARLQQQVLAYLQSGLAHNVGANAAPRPVSVRVGSGTPGASIAGTAMDVSGAPAGRQADDRRVIHARFAARGKHVYQAVVISKSEPPQEQIEQFFTSWQLD